MMEMRCEVCKHEKDHSEMADITVSMTDVAGGYTEDVYTVCKRCADGTLRDIKMLIGGAYTDPWEPVKQSRTEMGG